VLCVWSASISACICLSRSANSASYFLINSSDSFTPAFAVEVRRRFVIDVLKLLFLPLNSLATFSIPLTASSERRCFNASLSRSNSSSSRNFLSSTVFFSLAYFCFIFSTVSALLPWLARLQRSSKASRLSPGSETSLRASFLKSVSVCVR